MKRKFDVVKCWSCGASHAVPVAVTREWREEYSTVTAFPLECCMEPSLGWPGVNAMDRVFLEVE